MQHAPVYVYLESTTRLKAGDVEAPTIQRLGPYVATHRRHYLQQTVYTICTLAREKPMPCS